ncbi:NAD(P)-binding protein [Thozetella sp. PMI_491]|nr:NAD(P)-binding protein [Thozetella sp. PMI_491]
MTTHEVPILSKDGFHFTKVVHTEPYPAISPLRPELSQAGKTVLITGGATGIGYATARAFAQAGASTIVISNRRAVTVAAAASKLTREFADKGLQAIGIPCDVGNDAEVEALWADLEKASIVVDVLVLSAASAGKPGPIMDNKIGGAWSDFLINVRGHIHFVQKLYDQKLRDRSKKLAVANVASSAIHDFVGASLVPTYCVSKSAGTLALQQIAKDTKPDDMQITSFHPGVIWTPMTAEFVSKESYQWDSEDLAGQFAVWAVSDEAKFLHGRFTWAKWDVEEMMSDAFRQKVDGDPTYLKVGVHGL